MRRCALLFYVFISTLFAASSYSKTVSYSEVLNRLVDLEYLSTIPDEGEMTAQYSSYDRSSVYDSQLDDYISWGANGDGTGYIRKEGEASVICEIEGPGVLWRIWTAQAEGGLVEIYLDGAAEPVLQKPFKDYFNNSIPPFNYPSLVYTSAMGRNCYLPITFSKSCRVVAHPGWGKYYHFTYSRFPAGTQVETFSVELAKKHRQQLEKIDHVLANCGQYDLTYGNTPKTVERKIEIPAGETIRMAAFKGAYAITSLKIKRDSLVDIQSLRQLVLKMYWEGAELPAVWSPLGDFFGSAPKLVEYKSLPVGVTSEYLYSYWYMPFKSSAVIEMQNDSSVTRTLEFEISYVPLKKKTDDFLHFHSLWHVGKDGEIPDRPIDWTFLKTTGQGRFCGLMLHIWNPMGGWWGEGDEKFFVDGEKLPSTFGTGTEDYFGYAWCSEEYFNRPYHNQIASVMKNPCAFPDRKDSGGHTCNSRFQIADNVPFLSSFEGAVEKYFTAEQLTHYAATVYWYQKQNGEQAIKPVAPQDRGCTTYRKDVRFMAFLDALEAYDGNQEIKKIRQGFNEFMADESYAKYNFEIIIGMAKAEKKSGNYETARGLMVKYSDLLEEPFIQRGRAKTYFSIAGKPKIDSAGYIKPFSIDIADGSVKKSKEEGRFVIKTQRRIGRGYVYFDVPDEVEIPENTRAVITVYVGASCKPSKDLLLRYDAENEAYRFAPMNKVTRVGNLYEVEFICENATFSGRQNDGADFRIESVDNDVCVADVKILLEKK